MSPRSPRAMALAFATLCGLFVAGSARAQDNVELRPVDRATVRLIAMNGVIGARAPNGQIHLGVRVAHGSGAYVSRDGWIATAAHVVAHADLLVVVHPGEEEGRAAEVVFVGADHDVALVYVGGRSEGLRMARRERLGMGQAVHASGYPLDPRERWPAAVSGTIGRPLNDGRIQLSMSVNPGNSGGPVITDGGELVGIVSQGANVDRGAQGFAIMEPIAPLRTRLRQARREAVSESGLEAFAVEILLEHLQARPSPSADARVARLSGAATDSPPSAALLAVEAVDLQLSLLRDAGVEAPFELGAAALERYQRVGQLAHRWAQLGGRTESDAYAALGAVPAASTSTPSSGSTGAAAEPTSATATGATPSITGPATGPSPHAPDTELEEELPPVIGFAFGGGVGLHIDDHPQHDGAGGGLTQLGAWTRVFMGYSPFFRPALELGATLGLGGWRDALALSVQADLGLRMEFGPRSTGAFVRFAWAPGYVEAEGRSSDTAIAYAAGVGVTLDAFELGLTWRETHRGAGTPLRSLQLQAVFEVTP